jgi:hypothetical protein
MIKLLKPFPLIDKKNNIIMDWSAKAGCTTAVKMFFKHLGILEKALEYDPWIHEYRIKIFSLENPVGIKDLENKSYYKFKVVRNPFARTVSSYIHAMKYTYEKNKIMSILKKKSNNISFSEFVKYLENIDITNCNIHHRQQKRSVENYYKFNSICKIENIKNNIKLINNQLGTTFDINDILSSRHHIRTNNKIKYNVSCKKWSIIRNNIPNYIYFYNPQLIERVKKIYIEDIKEYNYSYKNFVNFYTHKE